MKTFREFIQEQVNEARIPWPKEITKRAASQGDIRKGENYTVVNTKAKEVLWDNLKRDSAKEVVEYLDNPDIIYGSSSFIYDKYISKFLSEASLKTGDNVSIKTKNFNAYGKIIGTIKGGAAEVKFFNDKTSKEEIAIFDLKQLTKI